MLNPLAQGKNDAATRNSDGSSLCLTYEKSLLRLGKFFMFD